MNEKLINAGYTANGSAQVVIVVDNGAVQSVVVTDASIQCLVFDREAPAGAKFIEVDGATAALDAMVQALPGVDRVRVTSAFAAVEHALSEERFRQDSNAQRILARLREGVLRYRDPLQTHEAGDDTTGFVAKVVEAPLYKVVVYDADASVREELGGYFADKAVAAAFADRAVTPAIERPVLVKVVATDACFPCDCEATGVLFPDGRLLIDYPFLWKDGGDNDDNPGAQIDFSHVVLPDGTEKQDGWHEISDAVLTEAELASVQACKAVPVVDPSREPIEALEKAVAILEQLQAEPEKARDIICQGYFGHALLRGRRALSKAAR